MVAGVTSLGDHFPRKLAAQFRASAKFITKDFRYQNIQDPEFGPRYPSRVLRYLAQGIFLEIYVFLQKYLYLHPASFGVNSQLTPPASFAAGAGLDTRAAARTTLSRPVGRVFVEERVQTRDLCISAQLCDAC